MFPLSLEAGDKRFVALSALAGVLLVLSAWKVRRWCGHEPSPEVQSSAGTHTAGRVINEHDAVEQSEPAPGIEGKLHSSSHKEHHHHHHQHHKHAKSVSSTSHGHNHGESSETERLLQPKAQTQPNYSGTSYRTHVHHDSDEHSSRVFPFNDTHDELASISHGQHYAEEAEGKKHSQSSDSSSHLYTSRDNSSHSVSHGHGKHVFADDFSEALQRCIDEHFKRNPEDLTYWEREDEQSDERKQPSGQPPPGKQYRDLALREARWRKEAFENSKRAFKMGKKAEARQLSEQGKVHDANAKGYNDLAAAEIFAFNNPRYDSGKLSRCDLHGLHVEEALAYARNHLVACRKAGEGKTMLIVGKGSHSQHGARIGPAIMSMLAETSGIVAGVHEKNDGCIVVDFAVRPV